MFLMEELEARMKRELKGDVTSLKRTIQVKIIDILWMFKERANFL